LARKYFLGGCTLSFNNFTPGLSVKSLSIAKMVTGGEGEEDSVAMRR
jgi:hypothetical protein